MATQSRERTSTVVVHGREFSWTTYFRNDVELLYASELRRRGYHPRPGTSAADLGTIFHEWRRRRLEHLEGRRLRVRYSREIKDQALHPATKVIAERARRGEPLWPYTSKNTKKNARYNDSLLNHWGVAHLHLGEAIGSDGYVAGRKQQVLCVRPANDIFYIIGVFNHVFAENEILDIVVRNWPESLEAYRLRGVEINGRPSSPPLATSGKLKSYGRTFMLHPTQAVSPARTTELREQGLCPTFEAETGHHYFAPGGGYSCAGTGMIAHLEADRDWYWTMQLDAAIESHITQIAEEIWQRTPSGPVSFQFHVRSLEEMRAAKVVETNSGIGLQLPLKFDYDFDPASVLKPLAAASMA